MLHCPPFDSLIRDHAVSLAVSVQRQLNTLLDKESVNTAVEPNEKRIFIDIHQESSRVVSAAQNQALVCKRRAVNDVVSWDSSTRYGKPSEIAVENSLHADMDVE